jgi:hypothetical protein
VHLDLATVTDLLHELEAYQPDAQVRLAQQPAWPFEDAIDPDTVAVEVDLDGTSVVDRGQGGQLGHLPEPARNQLGS